MIRPRTIALALALSLASAAVSAAPLLGPSALPPQAQRTLSASIRAERTAHPEHFTRVHNLVGLQGRFYRATRGRTPEVTQELRALGPDALLPMLDALAFSDYPRALSPEEREALEVGILNALSALRDRRAEPVLRAAFDRLTATESVRAAARALGALAGDGEVAALTTAARQAGPRQAAALEGLGVTRRADAARVIAEVIDTSSDVATLTGAARGVAEVGSTWAQAADGHTVTLAPTLTASLVRAYVRVPAARVELMVALAAIATYDTVRAVADARADADADTARHLATLERVLRRGLAR